MRTLLGRVGLGLATWMTMSAPATASATVTCDIDDKFVTFAMQASAGRDGPITNVQGGTIQINPAAGKLAMRQFTFDRTHIVQQWSFGGDMRLQIEVGDEAAKEYLNLVILARLDEKTEKYGGRYILRIIRAGVSKVLNGRIRDCESG
jgi:hypothetical protein